MGSTRKWVFHSTNPRPPLNMSDKYGVVIISSAHGVDWTPTYHQYYTKAQGRRTPEHPFVDEPQDADLLNKREQARALELDAGITFHTVLPPRLLGQSRVEGSKDGKVRMYIS